MKNSCRHRAIIIVVLLSSTIEIVDQASDLLQYVKLAPCKHRLIIYQKEF